MAYRNGARWAADTVKTARASTQLEARSDRAAIHADGTDLAFVTVRVTDANGLTVPRADNLIHFAIDGPGEIVATDNGDPTNLVPFSSHDRRAFNGMCLAIVRVTRPDARRIVVRASGDGLRTTTVPITIISEEP